MLSHWQLVSRYAAFAAAATFCNLLAQRGVLFVYSGYAGLALAIAVGTGAGLVVKYILDKHWIFADTSTGLANHSRKFALYTLMGVVTTAIFWLSETAFWAIWHTQEMREIGAVLGLTVGYVTKYQLDKRFVFNPSPKVAAL